MMGRAHLTEFINWLLAQFRRPAILASAIGCCKTSARRELRTSRLTDDGCSSAVVELGLVDDANLEAEGRGDFIEKLGVGEEPLPAGASADSTAVVCGV
jgi:hypothetical protein